MGIYIHIYIYIYIIEGVNIPYIYIAHCWLGILTWRNFFQFCATGANPLLVVLYEPKDIKSFAQSYVDLSTSKSQTSKYNDLN